MTAILAQRFGLTDAAAFLCAGGMFISATAQSLALGQYFFRGFRLGLNVRVAVGQVVYAKALALPFRERQRFGTGAADQVTGVSVGDDGTIYVAGTTSGNLDGAGNGGGKDAYIRALGADGTHLYTRQFGGAGDQTATAVAFDDNGNLAVALKDGDGNGSIQKFSAADGTSAALWSHDLGNLNGGSISALDFDGGALYAGGSAGQASDIAGANPGHSGGRDGFLLQRCLTFF